MTIVILRENRITIWFELTSAKQPVSSVDTCVARSRVSAMKATIPYTIIITTKRMEINTRIIATSITQVTLDAWLARDFVYNSNLGSGIIQLTPHRSQLVMLFH